VKVFLRRFVLALAAFVGLLVLAFVIVVSIGVRVDLDALRLPAQTLASEALGREVAIEGAIVLVPTWSPTFEVEGVRIANPEGWGGSDFARLKQARVGARLLPLLRRHIAVHELSAQGVEFRFERRSDGDVNWLFELPGADDPELEGGGSPPIPLRDLLVRSAEVEQLALTDITAHYSDQIAGVEDLLELTALRGGMGTHEPLRLDLTGHLGLKSAALPYHITLHGGPPVDLFTGSQPWPLELVVEIAEMTLSVRTQAEEPISLGLIDWNLDAVPMLPPGRRFGKLDVALNGEALRSLEPLLLIDLPPWGPITFEGGFEAFEGGRYAADIALGVGQSRLEGTLEAQDADPPRIDVKLRAPSIQLDDFATAGWSAFSGPAGGPGQGPDATEGASGADPRSAPLLSPETLRRVDGSLTVSVTRVRSGEDKLGRGHLTAGLEKGRLSVQPIDLEFPGGNVALGLVYHPTKSGVATEISAQVDHFDYGILARRVDPESEMNGRFSLDMQLSSVAPSVDALMGHATGHLDFAVFPESLEAGGIDVWVVNVMTAVLPAVDEGEGSRINCAVGIFDVENGKMHEQALVLDTSNMTVRGKAEVDFETQQLLIQLAPDAKQPEFFSLATPIQVKGSFEDFGLGVQPEDLIGTVIRMITSVVHVPLRRIFVPNGSGEEMEACLAAIERAKDTTPSVSAAPPLTLEKVFRPAPRSSRRVRPGSPAARIR
jgi:hypothetical protein